ncbi:hypothetical protein DCAR_0831019 [Daucus carota subsp. sativus]|uniref:Uncharacterized protein n=1 Tax=Daucus carota subsp. sativus TaxID=79200 RepID=A0AAF0XQU4_DAUCS|nr:hypothetical protein DCAR_0831019 [Daucus carota subsp. sativus]
MGSSALVLGANTRTSRGSPILCTTLAQSTLDFGVLMGSGALVLV